MPSLDDLQETVRKRIEKDDFKDGWDIELSKWLAVIIHYKKNNIQPQDDDIDSANRFLSEASKNPDIGIIQDIRQRMMLQFWSRRRGLTRTIVRLTDGGLAIPSALLGLGIAVLVTAIGALLWFGIFAQAIPADQVKLFFMRGDELAPLLLSAMLGAIAGQLSRINSFGTLRTYHPALVAMNGLFKPLTTMILAVAIFAILKSELIKIASIDFTKTDDAHIKYLIWVVGFLSGFSERFAPDIVRRAEDAVAPSTGETPSSSSDSKAGSAGETPSGSSDSKPGSTGETSSSGGDSKAS